jgi:predicted ATPase/class 3 adenylate cyclase
VPSCPSCGKDLPGEFAFCPFCAAPLTATQAAAVAEERKVVSVLFCDLVGFTASSDAADPEDVRARIRPYHARLREVIERFGGTVEKFVGDAVMAVFGAPVSHEDDAERAVRAGLRILEAIEELNAQDASLSLQVRVGINTGEAVVALGARPEEGEGIVTGDVVNTASRLQGAAPVDGVAVSEQTFRLTERVFEWAQLEPVTVKGKPEPLQIHRPLRPRARFGSDVTRSHGTPLVGRELEKSLLIGTFERSAQQYSCQLVTVVGEPGVGKSRLCAELFHYIEERPALVRWRQGRCLPYGEGIAFWALGEIVKAECGILESDSPDDVRGKLERAVSEDAPDRPWLLARLSPLVGLAGEPAAQEESFTAWRHFLEQLGARGPAVLVFEDLHWADHALLAFLEDLADWSQGVPLLLLCTARHELHEQHPRWAGGLRNATTINLPPLSDQETAELVSALLERAGLATETQRLVLEQAGGNPLYAEEFVRLLTDRGGTAGAEEVPESVQALIAARLDTLSAERKALLQDASVIGKVFWSGAVAAMGDRDLSDVERALHELSRKELIRPDRSSSMEGESEYGFWHALVRDVCYGQIPRAGRAERHRRAAAWLEQKAGERSEDLADVLAHHYVLALQLTNASGEADAGSVLETGARRYLSLAGERALALDVDRAEQNFANALALTPAEHPERAALLERWAQAALQQNRLVEAKEALEEALALSRAQSAELAQGRVLTTLSLVLQRLGDPHSEKAIDEGVDLLHNERPGPELVAAYAQRAMMNAIRSAHSDAIEAADRAVSLASGLGLPEPARALGFRGFGHACLGDRAGLDEMRHALWAATEQGLGHEAATLHNNVALISWLYDGPQAALTACREGTEFCERRGIAELAQAIASMRPTILAELGQVEQALAEAETMADRLQSIGSILFAEPRALEVRLLVERGEHEKAPDIDEVLQKAREAGHAQVYALTLRASSRLLAARGFIGEARNRLAELERVAGVRADPYYAFSLAELVRTALAAGDDALVQRLIEGVESRIPAVEHALCSARAARAEAAGDQQRAAALYAQAAELWHAFGNAHERAHALLGQGRCLRALGNPETEQPLRQASELFASMGYQPALAEAEALLNQKAAI